MLRLKSSPWIAKLRCAPGMIALGSVVFVLSGMAPAYGQDFTLSASAFNPYAIDQGQSTLSTVTLSPINGFSGTVGLVCTVTGGTAGAAPPLCQVSPTVVTPPATASLTFPAAGNANPGSYVVTVTGTGSAGSCSGSCTQQQSLNISVLAVEPSFTVIVQQQVQPNSVHAGSSASALIYINASNNYQDPKGVWLSCATISPLVIYPPTCSFTPQPALVTGASTPVTLTISTSGNAQTAASPIPRGKFYALWLPWPMLAFVGIGAASSKRSRKAWILIGLFVLAGSLILIVGCGNTNTGHTAPLTNIITPKNAYTFTLMGVGSNGIISTDSGKGAPTVTLTVD
jgi:hypothetical protein